MKKVIIMLLLTAVSSSVMQAEEEKPESTHFEITVKLDIDSTNPSAKEACDKLTEEMVAVAAQCQGCNAETLEPTVEGVCACIKNMTNVMKTEPDAKGELIITIKDDNEQGVEGHVRRR